MNTTNSAQSRNAMWSLALVLLVVVGGSNALSWWRDAQAADHIKAKLGQQRITLYTTQSCVYCTKAKRWLSKHDLAWDECDVERDSYCKATFEAQGAPGTPLVRIGAHWSLGFDPAWIAQALTTPAKANDQSKPSDEASPRP
jgi:glutaredoxin